MAALIGYLNYGHHAGTIHRLAHRTIQSQLATWTGNITTTLDKAGNYTVHVTGKGIVSQGNVNPEPIKGNDKRNIPG